MPSASVAVSDSTELTPQQRSAAAGRSTPNKVTGRLKQALDLMVWQNLPDNEAAVKAKLTVTAIRLALRRPHVRAYFREQSDVLREREGPRGIHTLIAVRDQTGNQAARVAAVREMRQANEDQAATAGRVSLPGLQIVIVQGSNGAELTRVTGATEEVRVISDV